MRILNELRRRRVFRTAALYIVAAWVALQVVALAFQSFDVPAGALRYVWAVAVAGFPLALVFGWRYDITSRGIVRTSSVVSADSADLRLRKSDYVLLAALAAVAVLFVSGTVFEIRQGPMRASGPWYASKQFATAIAVLPFENLSGDDAQNFVSAGIHDALITTLSRITRFRVTSRYSTRSVRSGLSLPDIGQLLGVDKVVSGSVTREGQQVRVNVSLVDAATDRPLWSNSYLREFDGLIAMQNEIASAVAREVKVQLTPEEERRLSAEDGPDSDTYEAYLKGMFQLRKETSKSYRLAIDILTEAVENDPTSALAYAGLAIVYSKLGHSPFPVKGAYLRAGEAASRALEYDPDLAEAHLALGMYLSYYEWDFEGAEEAFLNALALNPSLVDAHYHYAWLLELLHRDEEAIAYGEYSKELNPLSPFYSGWLAEQYRDAGMYEQAIDEAKTTLELNPKWPPAWISLGQTYLDTGRTEEAIEAHTNLRNDRFWGFYFVSTLASAGREEDAEEVQNYIEQGRNNPFTLSLIYAGLGDTERTFELMYAARDAKIPWYPWLITWFPQTKYLHADPRMQELAAELGLVMPD